jgi:hypothetical protein
MGRAARAVGLAAIAVVASCGGAPERVSGPPAGPASDVGAPPSSLAGSIEPVAGVGCELRTEGPVDGAPRLELFASLLDASQGRVLARARYESATFSIPGGEPSGAAWVEGSGWGASFAGLVRAPLVPVWVKASRPLASGMILPQPRTRVSLVQIGAGSVQVRVEHHELLDPRSLPVVETVACADLQASPPPWSGSSAGKEVTLGVGEGLELFPMPESAPEQGLVLVARKEARDDTLDGKELERRGEVVRVEVPSNDGHVRGWISATAVRAPQHYDRIGPPQHHPADAPRVGAPERRICKAPLRFAAIPAGREPVWLGELRAGTVLGRDLTRPADARGFAPIEVAGIEGDLVARSDDLNACEAPEPATARLE